MTLPEPARSLWMKTADALEDELKTHLREYKGWRIGGGTVLAARWGHRRSTDIDIKLRADAGLRVLKTSGDPETARRFHERMKELGAVSIAEMHEDLIVVNFPTGRIDIFQSDDAMKEGQMREQLEHRTDPVASNAQILHGKMGRWARSPTRDVFDVAVANELAPEALETAVNGLPPDSTREIRATWRNRREHHARLAGNELLDIDPKWKGIAQDPVRHALAAWEERTYQETSIEMKNDRIVYATKTVDGREQARSCGLDDPVKLGRWLHTTGCLLYSTENGLVKDRKTIDEAMARAKESIPKRPRAEAGTRRDKTIG